MSKEGNTEIGTGNINHSKVELIGGDKITNVTNLTVVLPTQIEEELSPKPIVTPLDCLDWQKLKEAFNARGLDKIPIKQIGEGFKGPEEMELSEVFFQQDVGKRTFEEKIENLPQNEYLLKDVEAHIWHFAKEHRDFERTQTAFDEKERKQVLTAFLEILSQRNTSLNYSQFQKVIKEVAEKLNKKLYEILAVLRGFFETTIKREPVLTYLKAPCSTLLIGDAGAGKTTAMKMLALNLFKQLEEGKEKGTPIPIFVRLDKIAEDMKDDQPPDVAEKALLTYICKQWNPHLNSQDGLRVSSIKSCSQPIQLILDGLDEIPSDKLRLKLAQVAKKMIENSSFSIILTSRPVAVDESLIRAFGKPEIRLLELTSKQSENFARNFLYIYNKRDEKAGEEDASAFQLALDDSPAAQEFATNPLYLTVMILMHKKQIVLPKRRLDLYQEFYKMLLFQRSNSDAKKTADKPPVFPVCNWVEDVYTPLLQRIAFITHSDDEDSVSITSERVIEAIELEGLQSGRKGITLNNIALDFLDFADETLGVLVHRGESYAFSHRSLQEYLAAMHLSEGDGQKVEIFCSEQALKKPDRWLEVARLLFCKIRRRSFLKENEYLYLITQWSNDIAQTNDPRILTMIGAILFDMEGFSKNYNLHQTVANAFASRRDESHDQPPQLFLACGDALGLMDEPQIDVADPPMVFFPPPDPARGATSRQRGIVFDMGSNDGEDNEKPIHPVTLSPYWLGKYPVTNKEFGEFIKAGGYENEVYWVDEESRFRFDGTEFLKELKEKTPRYWLDERFGKSRPLAPVVGISWYEAMAYCCWWTKIYGEQQGIMMHLPTEAEWEFAARGFECRKYPWGEAQPSPERLNYGGSELKQTSTVGSYPQGATPAPIPRWRGLGGGMSYPREAIPPTPEISEGVFDLAGNVWEWCYDRYGDYKQAGSDRDESRVLRGGSWFDYRHWLRGAYRVRNYPWFWIFNIGFRCARVYS